MQSLMHVLMAHEKMPAPSAGERIRVQAARVFTEDERELLRREIIEVVAFTQNLHLSADAISFVAMEEEAEAYQRALCAHVNSRPAKVQVVITAFNGGAGLPSSSCPPRHLTYTVTLKLPLSQRGC